ncbi:PepSY domain-containing protein [Ramlibacter sp.]|uniref:PepSY domain-containing protein n=1 Tax=Ramlibacter sp. TaxID=1917967 RepID=UPI003D0D4705
MNPLPLLRRGLPALCLAFAALPGLADDDCRAPVQQWQSRDAVLQMAATRGWQVRRLKIDDGCYEIRGTDAQGQEFKAKIDPQTLRVVKIKQEHRERAKALRGETGR